MEIFKSYLEKIDQLEQRMRVEEVLDWVASNYPSLVPKVAWNQPMFTDHGTFIIAFSTYKHHMAVGPEQEAIEHFSKEIVAASYDHTQMLMRISWDKPVNYELLKRIIDFNMAEKADCTTFWRTR